MGGSNYSSNVYNARVRQASTSTKGFFDYDHDIKSGYKKMEVHPDLDPKKLNKAGKVVRESLDSDTHPQSKAAAVLFDVTGTMGSVPKLFVNELGKLMGYLIKKNILASPHVMFGAIGDAYCDAVPLQIGQFEAGNEMDDVLSKIVLEGGGGGQQKETYELALYFLAYHTKLDCFDKRGEKAYLIISGDENLYPSVQRSHVEKHIGITDETKHLWTRFDEALGQEVKVNSIPTETVLAAVQEKFEVFFVMPDGTSNYDNIQVNTALKQTFGERFIKLPDAKDIVALIGKIVGLCEGLTEDEINSGLRSVGVSDNAINSTTTALAQYKAINSRTLAKKAVIEGLTVSGVDATIQL